MNITVSVIRLPHAADLPLPDYATPESAGCDLFAAVDKEVVLAPGKRALIPSGIKIMLPDGFEAQIRPRSGLAFKHGITLLNSPGTVDSDYRGEIGIILINHGDTDFTVTRGMRIAQMVIAPITYVEWKEVKELNKSSRGEGGFGSTGH
jgi:dUTP pyrophosphatase